MGSGRNKNPTGKATPILYGQGVQAPPGLESLTEDDLLGILKVMSITLRIEQMDDGDLKRMLKNIDAEMLWDLYTSAEHSVFNIQCKIAIAKQEGKDSTRMLWEHVLQERYPDETIEDEQPD